MIARNVAYWGGKGRLESCGRAGLRSLGAFGMGEVAPPGAGRRQWQSLTAREKSNDGRVGHSTTIRASRGSRPCETKRAVEIEMEKEMNEAVQAEILGNDAYLAISEKALRRQARRLEAEIAGLGVEIGHAKALEMLGRIHGHAGWRAFRAHLDKLGAERSGGARVEVGEAAEPGSPALASGGGQARTPKRFEGSLEEFVGEAGRLGASSVEVQGGAVPKAFAGGATILEGTAAADGEACRTLLSALYESESGVAKLNGGRDLDFARVWVDGGMESRWRVNATNAAAPDGTAPAICMMATPTRPPKLAAHSRFKELAQALDAAADGGLIVVSGPTGSGKRTLLGSLLDEATRSPDRKIVTYEAPLTFEYENLNPSSVMSRSELGRHLDAKDALRNALRRHPTDIALVEDPGSDSAERSVGEAECAQLGCRVLTSDGSSSLQELARRKRRKMSGAGFVEWVHSLSGAAFVKRMKMADGTSRQFCAVFLADAESRKALSDKDADEASIIRAAAGLMERSAAEPLKEAEDLERRGLMAPGSARRLALAWGCAEK